LIARRGDFPDLRGGGENMFIFIGLNLLALFCKGAGKVDSVVLCISMAWQSFAGEKRKGESFYFNGLNVFLRKVPGTGVLKV